MISFIFKNYLVCLCMYMIMVWFNFELRFYFVLLWEIWCLGEIKKEIIFLFMGGVFLLNSVMYLCFFNVLKMNGYLFIVFVLVNLVCVL